MRKYDVSVVGLTHSRGVGGVMPAEGTEPLEGVSDSTQREILEMPYTDMGKTSTKMSLIAGHAQRDPEFQFTSLAHLLNEEFLRNCGVS